MSERDTTRRTFVKGLGAAAGAATLPSLASASGSGDWTVVESPTGNTLYDVERTAAGLSAVGAGGIVLERTRRGWRKLLDGGPTGNGNNLYGADVTDDGERLWFVGSSGAIGEYDLRRGVLVDHSAPNDVTNNFNDVSVTGPAGEANVYVAGDSGKTYYSFDNGATGTWNYTTPGSGSAINAIDFFGPRYGHAIDGNKTVFYSRDGGSWDKQGIENADHNFYGVDSDGFDDVWVCGGGGTVFHWNGSRWVRTDLGDASLRDIEVTDDDGRGLTVGGGGAVFQRSSGRWRQQAVPTGQNLKAVVRSGTDVAVGAGGTIVER
jgi:hypothetical protein